MNGKMGGLVAATLVRMPVWCGSALILFLADENGFPLVVESIVCPFISFPYMHLMCLCVVPNVFFNELTAVLKHTVHFWGLKQCN